MKKTVIDNSEQRLNIVILRNDDERIVVKGMARCNPEDTYNEEIGKNLANARAWMKYYQAYMKNLRADIEWFESLKEMASDKLAESQKKFEDASNKYAELNEECAKILGAE